MNYDFLIIGQGLAGTLIGHHLEQAGRSVYFVDNPAEVAASQVAAGIINPITGRRFVKSWRIDELLPYAKKVYTELEQKLGATFWYDLPLVRTLFNRGDVNHWEVRSGEPGYADYLEDDPELGVYADTTLPAFGYGGIRQTARVDIAALVKAYRQYLQDRDQIRLSGCDYAVLQWDENGVDYDGIRATQVIFCEGWRARLNPWFCYLPHGGNKGEVLRVTLQLPPAGKMLKHRIFLVPETGGTFWVGATSENQFNSPDPSAENRQFLIDRLADLVQVPYSVQDHLAAVRPTVRDRRPILGCHPRIPQMVIFNGLGTKGASLGPQSASWLAEHLLLSQPLPTEVDIQRFSLPI